jgi:hypothetical protein
MTSTSKRIFYGAITFGLILLWFRFDIPVTTSMTVLGTIFVAFGLFSLVIALMVKRGNLHPGSWWGPSAIFNYWQGIGAFALGLGHLSHLIVASDLALKLRIVSTLVFITMVFVGRIRAKVAGEI